MSHGARRSLFQRLVRVDCVVAAALSLPFVSCAAASGYDPKRYDSASTLPSADPDTEPLPPAPKATIRDPKSPKPSPPPAPPEAPAPSVPAAPEGDATCGPKENPCPLQKLMRSQLTAASTPEALEAAFDKVAGLSPNASWAWASIAKKGAELAKAGDVAGAKAQCKACHDQHKDAYKKQYRTRKI